jgi:hypothetical protein
LAEKHSIAAVVRAIVRKTVLRDTDPRQNDYDQVGDKDGVARSIQSARRAASSPTPDRKEEFILDSHGRPMK